MKRFKLFPHSKDDNYDIVEKGTPGQTPYWLGVQDNLSLEDAVYTVNMLNGRELTEDDGKYFFYDEGNGHTHRVSSWGKRLEGRQEPIGHLVPFIHHQRIWIEVPSLKGGD